MDGEDAMPAGTDSRVRLTYDDFLLFPDDGKRHELIDGVHYVTLSPALGHQRLLGRLHLSIAEHLRNHPTQGEVFLSPLDVVLSNWDVVEPDLLFVASDQVDILTEKNVRGAPAIAVEILSPGTRRRDLHLKRQLFERTGVREYWIVDGDARLVRVLRRDQTGAFDRGQEYPASGHAVLTTSLLAGWSLAVDQLFA